MEYVIGLLVITWVGYIIYQGYKEENAPALTMKDNGHGIMEPVCALCSARLVTVDRKEEGGLRWLFGILLIFAGLAGVFINVAIGVLFLIVGILFAMWGKPTVQVLTCPACGADAKIMR